jgi:hypothetical protein
LTWWKPRKARETVAVETPASSAISLIPATTPPFATPATYAKFLQGCMQEL